MQHLNFVRESVKQGVEHHAVVREDHLMMDAYENTFSSVTTLEPLSAIPPRTINPLKLSGYFDRVRSMSARISAAIKKVDADLLWCFNDAFLPAPIASKKAGVPAVTHFLGMTSYTPRPVGLALARFHKRYSEGIITCQEITASHLVGLGYPPERIDVVYHGVDVSKFTEKADVPALMGQSIKVGMVANMDKRKGHLMFIEAAALVLKAHPNVEFLVAGDLDGDPDYLNELRAAIGRHSIGARFTLLGKVPDMSQWYASVDICCVPSVFEALSVASLEAMAASLPIVATNVGGNPICVDHGRNGFVSPAGDAAAFARYIGDLVASGDMRRSFGNESRKIAVSKFSLSGSTRLLNEVFERRKAPSIHSVPR